MVIVFRFSLLALLVLSCRQSLSENSSVSFSEQDQHSPAPPPPPREFELIGSDSMSIEIDGVKACFSASLFVDRLYYYQSEQIQTYSIRARYADISDSFYVALPSGLNVYWQEVVMRVSSGQFEVGYRDEAGKFMKLYEIYLGDRRLNPNRIFIRYAGSTLR